MSITVVAPLIGLLAGLVSGLFGVGGGVIVVPGLVLALGFGQRRASGTSMATIVVSAAAALLVFARDGAVDWPAAALLGAGAMAGAWLGAHYLDRVPERLLAMGFVALLLISAARMAFA